MDITGQYFCSFNIKGQTFNEVFKVVLEASVSVLDKNGILLKRHISKVAGRQLVIQNIMKEKLEKGIDLSDIAFDEQTDYDYDGTTSDLNKSRYSDVTFNTMSLRNENENNHQVKAECKHISNLQVKDIQIVQKLRQDCFWVHIPENLAGNSERSKHNAAAKVAQQKTNTQQINTQNTRSPGIKCVHVWAPPVPFESNEPSSENKCQTIEAEDASHAENVTVQEIKKERVESDYELTNATSPNVEQTKLLSSEQRLPKTDSVGNSVPNEFELDLNHIKTDSAENGLPTITTTNSRSPSGTINMNSDSYSQTLFDMDSKCSESPLRIGQKSEECHTDRIRGVSKNANLEKSSYFPNCDDADVVDSSKTAFKTNSHPNVLQTDSGMNDSVTVKDLNNIVEANQCQKIDSINAEDFNDIDQCNALKPLLLNRLTDVGQLSDMADNLNANEQIYAEQAFETNSPYDNEEERHSVADDTISNQSSIVVSSDNADNIDLVEDTDSEDEEFFVFCDEPGDVQEVTLGEVNNAETQTHTGETGDLEGQDKQINSCHKKRKYKPLLPERSDHAYSHKKKRKTKRKSRVKTGDHVVSCADTNDGNVQSKVSGLKDHTRVDTAEQDQASERKHKKYKSKPIDDCKFRNREENTVDRNHVDGITSGAPGRRNRRSRCNYNINYKQLDDLYASIDEEDDELLAESQIKSEDEFIESKTKMENLESDCRTVKIKSDPDFYPHDFESRTKATRKADSDSYPESSESGEKTKVTRTSDPNSDPESFESGEKAEVTRKADPDYDPENFESGKKTKVTRKVDPDYDPSDISDMSDDEENDHESPVSEIDSEVEGKIADRMRKKRERKTSTQQFRVDLSEHVDKYEIVKFVSKEQRNRGRPLEEISHDSFSCKLCQSYQTADENCMAIHIGQHIHGKLGCDLCGKEFSSLNNKAQHYKNEHPQTVKTKKSATICEICGVACSGCNVWKRHMYNTHKIPSFECRFCGSDSKVKYPNQKELQKHMNNEHPDKLFSCDKCGSFFLVRAKYKVHKATCKAQTGEEAQHVCQVCNKIFDTNSNLTKHVKRAHQKEKCFKCEFCSYATLFQKNMKRHKAIHLDLKKYKCSLCPYAAVEGSQLQSHMRTHTGEKPFKCDKCAYAAAWNVQLKDHMKVHELETAVTCDKCGVVLKNNSTLKRHDKKEHQ